jgi:hypothetical protein
MGSMTRAPAMRRDSSVWWRDQTPLAQGGAFIVFNHFDQASRFQYKTIELLIDAVPQYWKQDHAERQKLGRNVLRMARVGLTPMDPYNTATVRGVVEMNWLVLPRITELWVKHYD